MISITYTAKGGFGGHILRRLTHIASILIPVIYYYFDVLLKPISGIMTANQLILGLLILIMILESLRLRYAWTLIGQRAYENHHISGFAWSICTSFLVVLTVKNASLAFPIIIAFAIGDPLMGELRQAQCKPYYVIFTAVVVIALIWQIFIKYYNLPWWLVLIMPPITVAAEWPRLRWIDDNALMQLVPLAFIWFLPIFI